MKKKHLKIGYFSPTNVGPSETFVYDLVKALNLEKDIRLSHIIGQKRRPGIPSEVRTFMSGYFTQNKVIDQLAYIIGAMVGAKSSRFQWKIKRGHAKRSLQKSKLPKLDVAFVDYATNGVVVMDFLIKKDIPFIIHVHGFDVSTAFNDKEYCSAFKVLCQNANGFIAASDFMKRLLVLNGCSEEKIQVIRLGVDSKMIMPLPWETRVQSNPSIIFLGRLTAKKHPIALLQAFFLVQKKIPLATLTIIGDGPLRNEVEEKIKELEITSKVKLLGALSREASFPIINKHWIYAQHSVTSSMGDQEGFAISLAEAALHELPVVSTIHNGITENVINDKTGYLVPEFNYEAMAEKIIFLIENPDLAKKMGKAGRIHITNLCDPDVRIKRIKSLLFQTAR